MPTVGTQRSPQADLGHALVDGAHHGVADGNNADEHHQPSRGEAEATKVGRDPLGHIEGHGLSFIVGNENLSKSPTVMGSLGPGSPRASTGVRLTQTYMSGICEFLGGMVVEYWLDHQ